MTLHAMQCWYHDATYEEDFSDNCKSWQHLRIEMAEATWVSTQLMVSDSCKNTACLKYSFNQNDLFTSKSVDMFRLPLEPPRTALWPSVIKKRLVSEINLSFETSNSTSSWNTTMKLHWSLHCHPFCSWKRHWRVVDDIQKPQESGFLFPYPSFLFRFYKMQSFFLNLQPNVGFRRVIMDRGVNQWLTSVFFWLVRSKTSF